MSGPPRFDAHAFAIEVLVEVRRLNANLERLNATLEGSQDAIQRANAGVDLVGVAGKIAEAFTGPRRRR